MGGSPVIECGKGDGEIVDFRRILSSALLLLLLLQLFLLLENLRLLVVLLVSLPQRLFRFPLLLLSIN